MSVQIMSLDEWMSTVNMRLDSLVSNIRYLLDDNGKLRDEMKGIKVEVADHRLRISQLERDISTIESDVSALESDVVDLGNQLDRWQ